MGLSITGITLMQVHWMLKTIKLNEENFDRAVNETIALVVDKLEKEKDIKFSMPIQVPFWYSAEEESSKKMTEESRHYDRKIYSIPKYNSKKGLSNYYGYSHLNRKRNYAHSDTNKNSFSFESSYYDVHEPPEPYSSYIDSTEEIETIDVIGNLPNIAYATDFNGDISQTVSLVSNDSLSQIIVVTNGRYDTINIKDLPKSLIPPPPPPTIDRVHVRTRTKPSTVRRSTTRIGWSNHNIPSIDSNYLHLVKESVIAMSEKQIEEQLQKQELALRQIDSNYRQRYKESTIALNEKQIEKQTKKQELALKQLVYEMDARKMELKDRVNFDELKNLFAKELENRGLLAEFELALVNKDSLRKEVFTTPLFNKVSAKSIYSSRLFPNNFVPLNDFLEIKFPNKETAVYKSVILPMSASLFFTLIVFLTFTITLITIIKQKKLAEMKADFINNMTHELKTPIATISLASDSIDNPKVVEKPETVKYFTAIIREENSRMNKLVESVLQTARLERKTLKLNLKEVNLSKLTERVADQMGIQVKAKEGTIQFNKPINDVTIIADENLMENVIFNLIDNAIKYSTSVPDIKIVLKVLPGGLSLSVEDNGIGMSRSEQQRVFEKFYRISQGDVHNIKGFGLGLSNVKEITELHGGMVQLRSELGIGSTFTLFFPNKVNGNE